ncbi:MULTISPECIES: hypothetical protein [unclassified Mesorhizobium]
MPKSVHGHGITRGMGLDGIRAAQRRLLDKLHAEALAPAEEREMEATE